MKRSKPITHHVRCARHELLDNKRWLLIAGLNPSNVAEAVGTMQPLAVDVSSGVESDDSGKKDPEMVQQFIASAKV